MSSSVFVKMCGFAATALLGAALAQADVQPTRILCYGDSTTWGQVGSYADVGGASYPCILQNLLGNRYEVKGICLGGSTVADMLVWRGVRELRTKPYYTVKSKTVTESSDSIVLKADGSYTGIAFTGDSNPFCLVTTGEDDICRGYGGYPVFGSATETAGLFWPSHDGAAFTKAEATACGLPAGAYTDYGDHLSDGIGRCRCYYDPKNAARFVDVEIRYSSSLHAAMRLLEPQASDVTIPSGSKIVPIDTTTTWKSDLHIIMFGLNDSGVLKSADYWELIKEATDRIVEDGGRYLVLMSESAGASRPKDWESKMQTYFGNRCLDLHEKFTEKDANGDYKCFAYAEALGYTNVRTNALQAAAKIPVTFQTDRLHPLEIGYDLMAHWVYDKLVELGEVEPEPASGTAVPPAAKTRIRYDGAEKMGVSAGCGYTLSGHLAADAGTYTATATLKSGFTWSDGTTASKPVSWEIEKVAPVWVQCKIEPSTWEEGNPPETISLIAETRENAVVTCAKTVEQLKALPAGSYKIAFTAAETANYKAGSKSVTVTVTPRSSEPGEVAAPTAVTGLKYTGREQTGVAAATGYTVTGGAATDAGDYTATATLADGYKWSDGTTAAKNISWSIAKGVNTWKTNPSVSPATWSVDAVPGTITIANGATTFGATVTCDTTEAALKALAEGFHTVTFTAAGTKNYDAISKTVTVTVTSGETPVDPDPPGTLLTPTNFTWCGGASGVWKSAENWQVEAGCSSDYPHEKWANVHFPSDADVTLNNTKLYIHNVTAAEGVSLTFRKSSGTNFRPTSPFAPPKNGSIVFDGASLAVRKEGENYSYLTFSLNSSVEFRNGCTLSSAATVFSGSATGGKKFTLRDNGRSFCADFNWRSGKSSTKANPAEIYVTNSVLTCVRETGCQLAVGSSGYTLLHVADGQFHLPCRFSPSGSAYAFRITLGASPETMPTNAPIYFARNVSLSNDVFAVDARACKVAGTYPLVVSGGKSFAVPSDWFDGEGALQATEDFDYTLQVASGMTGKVRQASDYLGLELVLTAGGDDPTPPGPEPTSVAVPTAVTGLAYTGKQQTGVAAGTGYTLTGNTATDAGDYEATATLAAGYKWTDGTTDAKTIGWSIAKGVNEWTTEPSVSPATWIAGTQPSVVGSAKFGKVTCSPTAAELKTYGEGLYTVTLSVPADGKNYDAISVTRKVMVMSGSGIRIARYLGDKAAALSFTFDDGYESQATLAAPILEQYGLRGTFFLVGHYIDNRDKEPGCMSWDAARRLSANGHEIANHGYNHLKWTGDAAAYRKDIQDNDDKILSEVGVKPLTFAYPYNYGYNVPEVVAIAEEGRIGSRKSWTSMDCNSPFDTVVGWIDTTVNGGAWRIFMTHGITNGWACWSDDGTAFSNIVSYVAAQRDRIWIDRFAAVYAYNRERDSLQWKKTVADGVTTLALEPLALDASLFNQPLTLIVPASAVDGTPSVRQGGRTLSVGTSGAGYLVDISPSGGDVVISSGPTPGPTPGEGVPVLTAPADGATVAMLTDRQKQAIAHGGESWDGGNLGDNKAHPVVLSWTGTTGPARVTVVRVKDGSTLIDETTDAGTLDAYNMLLGEEYRWTVTTASGSVSRTFTVELQAPRVIMVQATNGTDIAELNMRDLGGWVGKDGHRVKQGLLYRSRKLSDPYPEGYDPAAVDGRGYPLMSDAAIFVLANRFGIRTELDFRSQRDQARGIVRSVLGPNVEYINQGMLQPEMLILQSSVGNSMLKANLDVIFDRSKYPLDFHCKDGNSRTGGLAYYLLGLLGVDIMDAAADYMWTKYAVSGKKYWADTDFRHMYANVTTNHAFTAADGTVYDRGTSFMNVCESFTLANGYTMAEIEAFREFMLEDYNAGEDPVVTHKHVWGAWETNVVATCTNEGSRVARCVNDCPDSPVATTNEVLPKLAHQYADGKCVVCGADDPGFVPPGPTPREELPEGYTAAAATTSVTGDSVWFDTNHKPTSDTVSQIKFTFTKDGGAGLYGYLSPSADDANDYRLAATGGKWMLDLGDNKKRIGQSGAAAACGTATANVENYLEIGNYYIKDLAADETLASVTPVTFSRDYTLRIFGKQAGYAAYGSVASLKIFEKGTLVHDFVPCVSPEGVTGLFDLCTSYFHKPDGTFAKVEDGDEPALTPVAAPVAATGLAYTGKPQTGVAAATGYTVTDGAATDAGDYTATATLADGYKWSDGTTAAKNISWSIAKGTNQWTTNPSISPASWAADAVPGAITIANGATTFGATVTCDTTVAALKALGEGDHTVTFTAAAGGKNYDAITKTVTVTVTAGEAPGPGPTPVEGVPVLTAPAEGARIDPLSWGQQLARATDYTAPTTADFSRYANPVHLEWTGTTGPAEVTVCRASDGHCIWQCVSETGSCDAYNCYIGEDHVWTVRTETGSASGHFTVTQLAPRIIYTHNSEGCFSNMRDEGGYRGLGGRRVRQGLIYRSCQFDSQSQGGTGGGTPTLDEVGLYDMTNRLGIKTDLDLRNDAETGGISGSGLGPNVRWIHISGLYPGSVGGSGSPTGTMQKELAVLLDPANYPLDFHCKGGRDRTGALGFVALGLLGVPERDLYLDYAWTWDKPDPNGHIGDWDAMIAGLAKLEGDTICEKLETLVRQCGFTDADIAAYREAMLEPLADPPVHFHDTALTERVAPTCSAEGRDVYSCTNAGCTVPPYAVTNTLPVVEHVWGDWTVVTEPTLGQAGLRRRTCSVCTGTEEIAIDALKPAAEATGADWGQVVTQQVDGVRQVTVSFTGTTCDWRWTLPPEVTKFDFLAVAGGGSGGVSRGGGGGAGGVVTGTVAVAQAGATVRAMVGAGGAAQTATGDGNDGESSYLRLNDAEVLAVYGGGGGGHYEDGRESFGRAGGNGGGAGGNGVGATVAGGAARAPHFGAAVTKSAAFGTAGGAGATSDGAYPGGGGGGGALMAGGDGTPKGGGGAGGDGLVGLLGGEETCFAGGGGGACAKSTPGPGGAGGGGTGGDTPTAGADGLGGGGGGSRSTRYGASGAGGSGIVVIRYVLDGSEPPGPPPGPGPDDPEPMDEGWGWSNRVTVAGQDYCVLAFTNTAAEGFVWTVPSGVTAIDYLVVGGGGGGGANKGGGGGAGFATNGTQNVAAGGTVSIRVGAGGAGAAYVRDGAIVPGENGKDSSLEVGTLSITAQGGGGGGTYNTPGESGGCGGGGGSGGKQVGGAGSQGWCGYKAATSYGGGGGGVTGGGAAPGGASGTVQQQAGGPGLECSITGETLTYGAGGAGNKGSLGTVDPVAGTDGTGNGGGAGEGATSGLNGGSGVVIIRYAVAEGPVPQKDPVIPGGESKTYATEAAAIAAKPEKVTPPDDVAQALAEKQEALASYVACFTVATRQNAAGQWVNVAELKPEVEAELQLQVDGGAAKVVDVLADVSLTSVTLEPVTPGFRYALEYGETLGTMAPQDSVIATEDSLALPLPKNAGATSGFYRVVVREAETK